MNRIPVSLILSLALVSMVLAGCIDSTTPKELVEPTLGDGKTDVSQQVALKGALGWGGDAAVTGAFEQDLQFFGYTVEVGADSVVTLEVTQKGSSRSLDSTLFVYGPRTEAGGFGTSALAQDDDAGWGRLSKLKGLSLPQAGTYLVVVGTDDAMGRGAYRLMLTCESASCAPIQPGPVVGQCHPAFASAIDTCVSDWIENEPEWFYSTTRRDLVEQCSDIEILAPAHDQLCAGPDAVQSVCGQSLEQLNSDQVPECMNEAWNRHLDGLCVFGQRYGDVFQSGAIVVLSRTELTADSDVNPTETAQLLKAITASAHDDVTVLEQVFERVDGGVVNQVQLWDASNRMAYTAYEFGAGDNSFGMIFPFDQSTPAVTIQDGDLYGCTTNWGSEMRDCRTSDDCAEGLTCVGVVETISRGRCIKINATPHPATDTTCTFEAGCPMGSGLQCQGARQPGDEGICRPAWMTGHFFTSPGTAIPDASGEPALVSLVAYGLATVDVEIRIDLSLSHPHVSELLVQLENPAGTRVTIFDQGTDGPELYLRNHPVVGFSGDESVNGVWKLWVEDKQSGNAGYVSEFGLTITSRWD